MDFILDDYDEATYSGGGIYIFEGTLNIKGSRIVGNRAAHQGGGVFSYEGTVNFDNSLIKDNIAAYGGGIHNHLGNVSVSACDITNNKALGLSSTDPLGDGGGVWNFGTFDFNGGCVRNNQLDDVYRRKISTETALKSSTASCCGHDDNDRGQIARPRCETSSRTSGSSFYEPLSTSFLPL